MNYLFIDTNVYLAVYSYASDQIKRLLELKEMIDKKEVKLIITEQVLDEFYKNREVKLIPSLESIENLSKKDMFTVPAFCSELEEVKNIKKKFEEIKGIASEAYKKLKKQAQEQSLEVDNLFRTIWAKAENIKRTEESINRAKRRMEIGNPPGKNGSLGDAINWELLLKQIPEKQELILISADKDYLSKLSEDISHPLKSEWEREKKSAIKYYSTISGFLKENYKKSKISDKEVVAEKELNEDVERAFNPRPWGTSRFAEFQETPRSTTIEFISHPLRPKPIIHDILGFEDFMHTGSTTGSAFIPKEERTVTCSCGAEYSAPKFSYPTQCPKCGSHNFRDRPLEDKW